MGRNAEPAAFRGARIRRVYRWCRKGLHIALDAIGRRRRPAREDPRARPGWLRLVVDSMLAREFDGRLTVAVDINPFWEPLTGVGRYLHQTLVHLADAEGLHLRLYGPTLFPGPDGPGPVVDVPSGSAIEVVSYPLPPAGWIPRRLLRRLLRLIEPLLFALQGNEVIFAPNFVLRPKFRLARGAVVVTVHDLAFRRFPWTVADDTRAELEWGVGRALARAREVITVSRTVHDELLVAEPLDPARVTAILHGPGHLACQEGRLPEGIPERYVLHVGTIEPRKNIGLLLAVWEAWVEEDPDAPVLVLCGRPGWKSEALLRPLARARAAGWLHQPGYVDDAALAALYRHALAVACPSLYEGFGLPLAEAMAVGTPVVASDIAVFREVAGDAAVFLPADDAAAWKRALMELAAGPSLRGRLAARGRERAAKLDWAEAADRTRAVLERAARDR